MRRVRATHLLRVGTQTVPPGSEVDVHTDVAKRLETAGLAKAVEEPKAEPERKSKPKKAVRKRGGSKSR